MKKLLGLVPTAIVLLHIKAFPQAPTGNNLTAAEVLQRIKNHLTVEWQAETVDTFKGGNPAMDVQGIATTFLATLEVLKMAHSQGLNMVITHEPTYYNHFDDKEALKGDSVLKAKQRFIEEHGMIVFRFHDHIHQTAPDGIYKGVVRQLGWQAYEETQRPYTYSLPPTNLEALARGLQNTFPSAAIRVVGDREMDLSKVGLVLGAAGSARQIASLQREDVDVLIIGETHEWETVEYVRDAMATGRKKALVLLGHAISEEGGMVYCADWLKGFITEVPVRFIAAGDPFWEP